MNAQENLLPILIWPAMLLWLIPNIAVLITILAINFGVIPLPPVGRRCQAAVIKPNSSQTTLRDQRELP